MRDLLVTLIVFSFIPYIMYRPYIGVLVWSWLGYMNPHRLAYGFAFDFPFAQIVFIVIFLTLIFSKEPKTIPWSREVIVLSLFLFWMAITTFDSIHHDAAMDQYIKVIKIQMMTFLTLMLMCTRERLTLLVWVIALSIGFYGIKGGIFTITTGGAFRVQGPSGTFFSGNNEMGLALIMAIPLFRFLQTTAKRKIVKLGLLAAMILCAVSIIGTQSRGALVGGTAMLLFLILNSRKKFLFGSLMAIAIPIIVFSMPQSWFDRMNTITNYQQDQSATGRIDAWTYAYEFALNNPLTGGGFEMFRGRTDAHSIYFEVLGEHGFVGLALFLLLGIMTWLSARWNIKNTKNKENLTWANDLSRMIQVSLIGYAVGGLFLGMAYFDLLYHLMAIVVLTRVIVQKSLLAESAKNVSMKV